jgi:hypothetical protein
MRMGPGFCSRGDATLLRNTGSRDPGWGPVREGRTLWQNANRRPLANPRETSNRLDKVAVLGFSKGARINAPFSM